MLPNLLIIGAARAGTTSLHHYLSLHPQIEMSAKKELRFFSHEDEWNRGVAWYKAQFRGGAHVRGETSPSYTQHCRFPDVPHRVHELLPGARFIYLVRDPVERFLSHYAFAVARGRERGTLKLAVLADDSRYVDCSLYYTQISRYLDYFDRSAFLVLSSEDLQQRTSSTLETAFRFLGVDESFRSPEFARRFNDLAYYRLRTPTGLRIEALNRLRVVQWIPRRWRVAVGRYAYRPFSTRASRPCLSEDLRSILVARLEDDAARFREWTGQSFKGWSV